MKSLRSRAALALVWLGLAYGLFAQKHDDGTQLTTRALLADTAAVEQGKPFTLGFHFKIADHWHAYWRFPGGLGIPFTITDWNLPKGWKVSEAEFPLPEMVIDPNGATLYAYEHEVLYSVKVTPPANVPPGEVKISAKTKWMVCADLCREGSEEFHITLPVGKAAPANAALFSKWSDLMPREDEPPTKDVKFDMPGKDLTVRVGGLPKDLKAEFFVIPPAKYDGYLEFEKKVTVEDGEDGAKLFKYPFSSAMDWSGLLVTTSADGKRKGWYIGNPPPLVGEQKAAEPADAEDDGETWDPFDDVAKGEEGKSAKSTGGGLFGLLLNGFLGGLLLNLMPCVLPVISLKIFGFIQQAGEAKDRVFKLGLAFCSGVFGFFLLLALLVLGLASANQSLGWGAQFSNPVALTVMVSIMFAFGLSLLGVFEVQLGGDASTKLSDAAGKEGLGGAFMHGFFTTLLGTSCTAPLVGPVIGAAVNEPGIRIFALFAAIATGLSLPYFLLTWKPAWMRFLPKPGMWMIRLKQVFGFVMIGFSVWLLSALPTSGMVTSVGAFLLALSIAAWLYGTFHGERWPLPVAVILILCGWFAFIQGTVEKPKPKPSSLLVDVRRALNEGRPVFVDFTADWCLNCKAYEKFVINTEPIQAALKAKNVAFVKADYTAEPADIKQALVKCKRAGVPLYVLFRKRGDYWLADGLTQAGLLEQLNKLP